MFYFSYGSNMSSARLRTRIPSAKFVNVATLIEHKLQFHKLSTKDRSGKCDAESTSNTVDYVVGVIFDISGDDETKLDKIEGFQSGYDKKIVKLETMSKNSVSATMYYATSIDRNAKPYKWYKKHVLIGAREHNLPADYIAHIDSIEALADPNTTRRDNELEIYR